MPDLSEELAAAVHEFAARVDAPGQPPTVELSARLTPAAARAVVEALRSYHDPRDGGRCDECGGRLDDLVCTSCGQPTGVFGQLIRERAARFQTTADEG